MLLKLSILLLGNKFFDSMVNRIYPSELQLNKANMSETEASFLDLHVYILDGFVKNFPFLDGDVPRSTSYGVYISQLIRFARVSSHVDDFNTRFRQQNFSNKDIDIMKFVRRFQNFIGGILT